MRYSSLACSLIVLLAACPADPEPGDTETNPTTGGDGCDTDDCCDDNPMLCPGDSTVDPTDDPPSSSSSDGTTSGMTDTEATGTDATGTDATGTDTEGAPSCEFEPLLAMLAQGKTEPTDCGTATLADDAAAWAAASACAAEAAAAQEGFLVAFEQPSIDSFIYDGYYGAVGFAYALGRLYSDTLGEPPVVAYSCTGLVSTPGCVPDVGQHCLECEGASEPTAVECMP